MVFPKDTVSEEIIGIDVGGANVKMSRCNGTSCAIDFPMWTQHAMLGQSVLAMFDRLETKLSARTRLAVTMTGEMADCFETRRHGVRSILASLSECIPTEQIAVYAVGNRWLTVQQAVEDPWQVAASNWYALAKWLTLQTQWHLNRYDVVLDIGSTTVDIIPLRRGQIATTAKTDRERMQAGQLVYTGMERTPVHAVVQALKVAGVSCPVMAEKFATVIDAHLVLKTIAEQIDNCDTADNKPRTRKHALARLARMVGEDVETLSEFDIVSLADQVLAAQTEQIACGLLRNLEVECAEDSLQSTTGDSSKNVIVSGHGRPLVERLKARTNMRNTNFTMLESILGYDASRCAPALAVAQLYLHHCSDSKFAQR